MEELKRAIKETAKNLIAEYTDEAMSWGEGGMHEVCIHNEYSNSLKTRVKGDSYAVGNIEKHLVGILITCLEGLSMEID